MQVHRKMTRPEKQSASRTERIRKWVGGGDYVVGVEVEVEYPIDAPLEPCLRPETVRYLEELADSVRRGDLAALQRAGTVYERIRTPEFTVHEKAPL
jgi:hypothetical protein